MSPHDVRYAPLPTNAYMLQFYSYPPGNEVNGLKPCPCCGSTKIHVVAPDDGCYCWECGLTMPKRPNWMERWNRRVKE